MFAPSAQLPKLLNEFDAKYLTQYTPCSGMDEEKLITAIAITHVEIILIHPFREGYGRLSRLLADVIAVQGRVQTAGLSKLEVKQNPVYIGYSCRPINGLRVDETLGQ